jgi:hypothetical protein
MSAVCLLIGPDGVVEFGKPYGLRGGRGGK